MPEIIVQSMVSHRTREPLVSIYWPKDKEAAQMEPDAARQFALNILQCAEAAEQDAFMMNFGTKHVGLPDDKAAMLINELRKFREQEAGP